MYCRTCGRQLQDGAFFCPACGTAVTPPPQAGPGPFPARSRAAAKSGGEKSPAGRLTLALALTLCLPYLLRSLFFALEGGPISPTVYRLAGIPGLIAAGLLLWLGSPRGERRPGEALLFSGVFAADQVLLTRLTDSLSELAPTRSLILLGALVLGKVLLAALLNAALGKLPGAPVRGKGRISGFFLALAALLCLDFLPLGLEILTPADPPSFLSTFGGKALTALAAAGLLTLAWKRRRNKAAQGAQGLGLPALGAGALLCAAALVLPLLGSAPASTLPDTVRQDLGFWVVRGNLSLSEGDMPGAAAAYARAGAHADAWRALAAGEAYEVPADCLDDTTLNYLAWLRGDPAEVRRAVARTGDPGDADLWLCLLRQFPETGDPAKAALEEELVQLCIGREDFVFAYPTRSELETQGSAVLETLGEDPEWAVNEAVARAFSGMMLDGNWVSTTINALLDLAEARPEDLTAQYVATFIGSRNTWDTAGHYERTEAAALRFLDLWEARFAAGADTETRLRLRCFCADMLLSMHRYSAAQELLEQTLDLAPEDEQTLQLLALCSLEGGDPDAGYAAAQALLARRSGDPALLRLVCIGALKHGEPLKAVETAGALADLVAADRDGTVDADLFLFNCVTYLAVNDNDSWTDFQYRVYDDLNYTDEAVLAALQENEFLWNYVNALYWQRDRRNSEAALPYAQRLLELQPDGGRIWYLNAMICYDLERFEEAKTAYLRADELEPDDPSILFALANTCDALGEYELAFDLCKRCLAHFPNGVDHSDDHYGVSYHVNTLYNRLKAYLEEGD